MQATPRYATDPGPDTVPDPDMEAVQKSLVGQEPVQLLRKLEQSETKPN